MNDIHSENAQSGRDYLGHWKFLSIAVASALQVRLSSGCHWASNSNRSSRAVAHIPSWEAEPSRKYVEMRDLFLDTSEGQVKLKTIHRRNLYRYSLRKFRCIGRNSSNGFYANYFLKKVWTNILASDYCRRAHEDKG